MQDFDSNMRTVKVLATVCAILIVAFTLAHPAWAAIESAIQSLEKAVAR